MSVTEKEFAAAEQRMQALRQMGHAVAARYDFGDARLVVTLNTGVQIAIPIGLIEELKDADPSVLDAIEISASGLGLHWPALDADVYVPGLLQGVFGSKSWMAAELGSIGGRVTSPAKVAAARENGRKGGRPRKVAAGKAGKPRSRSGTA